MSLLVDGRARAVTQPEVLCAIGLPAAFVSTVVGTSTATSFWRH